MNFGVVMEVWFHVKAKQKSNEFRKRHFHGLLGT